MSGGNPAAAAAAQRRRAAGRGGAAGRGAGGAQTGPTAAQAKSSSGILRFYTEDSPGLQVGPTQVLIISLSFVGVVVLLHIWGKFVGA